MTKRRYPLCDTQWKQIKGLLTTFTDPDAHTSTMKYNRVGRLLKDTNTKFGFSAYQFDPGAGVTLFWQKSYRVMPIIPGILPEQSSL